MILLVGLVLSDLFTGGDDADPRPGSPTATDFGGEVQAGIYPSDPPTAIYRDKELDVLGINPGLGSPLKAEPGRGFTPPPPHPTAPNETRGPSPAPAHGTNPPTPERDTMQARQRDALARVDATLEMFAIDNRTGRTPTPNRSPTLELASDPTENDRRGDDPTSVKDLPHLPAATAGSV
ncbi:MAG: hypothetical protein AAGL98_04435, partial [Planctomycetota bacterium]